MSLNDFLFGSQVLEGKLAVQERRLEELKSQGKPVGNVFRQLIAALCDEEVRVIISLVLPRSLISPSSFVSDSVGQNVYVSVSSESGPCSGAENSV